MQIEWFSDKDALIYYIEAAVNREDYPEFYHRALSCARKLSEPTYDRKWDLDRNGKRLPGRWVIQWEFGDFVRSSSERIVDNHTFSMAWFWLRT